VISRRDGTLFINLLMCAPLYDDKGHVHYFIGTQVDVTGLVLDGKAIVSFRLFLQSEWESDAPCTPTQRAFTPEFKVPNVYFPTTGSDQQAWRGTVLPVADNPRSQESLNRLKELSRFSSLDEVEVVARNSRGSGGAGNAEQGGIPIPPASADDASITEGRGHGNRVRGQGKRVINQNADMRSADIRRTDSPQPQMPTAIPSTISVLPGVYKHVSNT